MDGMVEGVEEMGEEERESKERERVKGTVEVKQSSKGYIPTNYSFQLIISSPPLSLS